MNIKAIYKNRMYAWRYSIVLLVMSLYLTDVKSQEFRATGIVKSTDGLPIAGANVKDKKNKHSTITDSQGRFSIQASVNSKLMVSYLGYSSQEVVVSGTGELSIILQSEDEKLDEVVVVGFGTQKKESVVGAISQIGNKELLRSASANISQALTGRLSGITTSQPSGAPGNDDAQIFIRGRASFAGDNQPLILVDGVERPFSQISPDDIETISVLKDASATAVYGVRGANGVVLVTTKRGKEGRPEVSLTANYQSQDPTRNDTYLNAYQSVVLLQEALHNDGLASQFTDADIAMYKKSSEGQLSPAEAQLYPNVNWYNEVLNKNAPSMRYNATIRGGTRRMRYFTSLDYYNQSGLYKNVSTYEYDKSSNTQFKRYGFRANLDFDLTKRLTLSVNFATRFEERTGPNIANENTSDDPYNDLFYYINHTPGWLFPVKYQNGFYGGNSQNQNNIVANLAEGGFYQRTNTINETNFLVKHNLDFITKGLSIRGLASVDYNNYYNRRFTAGFATYELIDRTQPDLESSYTRYNEDKELSYAGNSQTTDLKVYMEFALDYARKFGEKHDVTALLLYNQNDYRYQADLAKRYQGLVGRITYNYDSRYFAEINAGNNGSENFAKGNRFGFFPSLSAGWMLSNENFMKSSQSWLQSLKLRASYGEVGNDRYLVNGVESRFLYVPSWIQLSNAYLFGDTNYQTGIYEGQYPNVNVTWERARKFNLGLESSLFHNKLTINADIFRENRDNILTSYLDKPSWLAQSLAPGNLGETTNTGYELDVKHNNHIGKVSYNLGFNYTHAHNVIKNMDEPAGKPAYRKMEGHSIGQYFGLVSEGFVTSADISGGKLPISTFGTVQAGDLNYKDLNNDGFIDERDVTFIGNSDLPENTFSFSLGASWKGFGINAMFQGVSHVSRYFDAETLFAFVNGGKVKEHHLNRWNPALPESENLAKATYPLLHYDQFGNHNQRLNSFFLENGSFLRLRNIEVSYDLPKNLIKNWLMQGLRFYVNANNLITWDKLNGLTDPESAGSNRYPIMRTVNIGLNATF